MHDLTTILSDYKRLEADGRPFGLATVVEVGGSAYRRPGARMLVSPDGEPLGAISGGCLEQEVARHALQAIQEKLPRRVVFDTSGDNPFTGFASGCGSTISVLVQPVTPVDSENTLALVRHTVEQRHGGTLLTVIQSRDPSISGRSVLMDVYGKKSGSLPQAYDFFVESIGAKHCADTKASLHRIEFGGSSIEFLVEPIRPRFRLIIVGEGFDVGPLVRQAAMLNWEVIVAGNKPAGVLMERFPEARSAVFIMHPDRMLDYLAFDSFSAAVLMSHNYDRDRDCLNALLQTADLPYVGVLGPSARTERILTELFGNDPSSKEAAIRRLYAPIGIDIGSETPEEIALSIVSEIQSVRTGHKAGFLKDLNEPIHETVDWISEPAI